MSKTPQILDIHPILSEVGDVIKKGIYKILYDYSHQHLTSELDKSKQEVEYYKKELKLLRKQMEDKEEYNIKSVSLNNISLQIEELSIPESESSFIEITCGECDCEINSEEGETYTLTKDNFEAIVCENCYHDMKEEFRLKGWECKCEPEAVPIAEEIEIIYVIRGQSLPNDGDYLTKDEYTFTKIYIDKDEAYDYYNTMDLGINDNQYCIKEIDKCSSLSEMNNQSGAINKINYYRNFRKIDENKPLHIDNIMSTDWLYKPTDNEKYLIHLSDSKTYGTTNCEACSKLLSIKSLEYIELTRYVSDILETFLLCVTCIGNKYETLRKDKWNINEYDFNIDFKVITDVPAKEPSVCTKDCACDPLCNNENIIYHEENVNCEMCEKVLSINEAIELYRETEETKESFVICEDCLEKNGDGLRGELWNVDDYLEEEEAEEELEYTEEEIAYNKIDDVMFNKKCLNTDLKNNITLVEEEEEEVCEIEIDDMIYFTNDEENGNIYEEDPSGEPGRIVGKLQDGEAIFFE